MWRTNVDAEWERRKEYLIRSLFQDAPPLSPVQEENGSDSTLSLNNEPYSPPRPLSPLIIEKEPNRHDEPEEYYKELEKRIMKVYRKLFKGGGDASSFDMTDVNSQDSTEVSSLEEGQTRRLKRAHLFKNESNDSEASAPKILKSDDENRYSTVYKPKSTSEEDLRDSLSSSTEPMETARKRNTSIGEESEVDTTNSTQDFIFVTFQADVHRAADDDSLVGQSPIIDEHAAVEDREAVEGNEILDGNKAIESDGGKANLENNEVSENGNHRSSRDTEVLQEIEVMRRPRIYASTGSLQHEGRSDSSCDDIAIDEEPRCLETHTESNSSEARDVCMGSNLNIPLQHRISTPKDVENEYLSENDSGSSASSSADSEPRCEDVGVQTLFDYGGVNSEILRNVFVGTPKVYRLCSCFNHSCDH